jgi:hypothetical protein
LAVESHAFKSVHHPSGNSSLSLHGRAWGFLSNCVGRDGKFNDKNRHRSTDQWRCSYGDPNGNRTRVSALKGPCPRPLDDGADSVVRLNHHVDGLTELVDRVGLEPTTFRLRVECSTIELAIQVMFSATEHSSLLYRLLLQRQAIQVREIVPLLFIANGLETRKGSDEPPFPLASNPVGYSAH